MQPDVYRCHYNISSTVDAKTFDAKMTFEKNLRSVSSAAAQRLGIMRKSWQVFHDRSLPPRSFWSFDLPVLEYCSAVWCSAAD